MTPRSAVFESLASVQSYFLVGNMLYRKVKTLDDGIIYFKGDLKRIFLLIQMNGTIE